VRALAIALLVAWSTPARAETAKQLVVKGEKLAKDGRLTEAIDSFKQADRIERRASHACLIALAYIRRELWPQAEIFLALCHERATRADPLPDWVTLADKQLVERLAKANVAAVHLRVAPPELAAKAQLVVSSFAPDELFSPRTIHLAPGKHLITATAGDRSVQQAIEIEGKSPREIVLDFDAREPEPAPMPAPPVFERPAPQPVRVAAPSRLVPWTLIALGGAIVAGGGAYHVLAFNKTRDRLVDATDSTPDPDQYDAYSNKFDTQRMVTIAMYGVGAAVLVTGIVLRFTKYRESPVHVGLVDGGAVVALEWQR
jgi:hypothetical protein